MIIQINLGAGRHLEISEGEDGRNNDVLTIAIKHNNTHKVENCMFVTKAWLEHQLFES